MLAVKVTLDPAHEGFVPEEIAIEIVGAMIGLMVMVIPKEVTEAGDAQAALDVSMQVTTCPFVIALVVNVGEFVPALIPFTCH